MTTANKDIDAVPTALRESTQPKQKKHRGEMK